ncbi:MAG: type II secretion system protein [Planctomycetes bacterium]|nr:type II secretion system protein [Planctomycetota bacterium]
MSRPSNGFSIIEMLVVISIIALLSALIVFGATAFGIGGKRAKTGSIVATVRNALDLAAADRGSRPAPAEHPLAGSLAPRLEFVRAGGGAVSANGVALIGVPLIQVAAAAQDRVLLADDLFADPDVPQLFALRRDACTILGMPQVTVTQARKLPPNLTATDAPDVAGFLIAPSGDAGQNREIIEQVLGRGGLSSELAGLGGLSEPAPAYTVAVINGRVLTDVPVGGGGATRWKRGHVADGIHPTEAPAKNWKPYRLPGLAVVDAWGTELLYGVSDTGVLSVTSAGADGAFAIDPGKNGMLETGIGATPQGDDSDGRTDNIVSGGG